MEDREREIRDAHNDCPCQADYNPTCEPCTSAVLLSTIDQLRGEIEEIREAWEPYGLIVDKRTDQEVLMVKAGDLRKLDRLIGRKGWANPDLFGKEEG